MSEHLKKLNEQDRSEQLTVQDITYATEHFGDAEWKEVVNALEDGLWETFQGHIDQLYSELSYQLEDLETLSSQDVELLQLCAFMKQRFEGVKYGYEGEASKKISIDGKVGKQTRAIINTLVPHYNTYHELATASSTKKELLAQSVLDTYPTPKIRELFKDQSEYILTFAQEKNKEQKEALSKYDETLDILNQYFQDDSFSISSDVSQEEYRSAYPDQSNIMDRNMMVAESTAVNNIPGREDYNLSSIPRDVVRLTLNGGESFVVKIDEDLQQQLIQRKQNEESIVLRTTSDNQTETHNKYFGFQNGYELSTDNFSIIDQEDNGTLLVKNRDGVITRKISPQESIKALDVESSVHNQLQNNADIKLMSNDMQQMQKQIKPLEEILNEFQEGGIFSHRASEKSESETNDLGIDEEELEWARVKAKTFEQNGLVYFESQVPHWKEQQALLKNMISDIDDNSPLVGMQRQIKQMIEGYDNIIAKCEPGEDGESPLRQFTNIFINPAQFYRNDGMSGASLLKRAQVNGPAIIGAVIGTALIFTKIGAPFGVKVLLGTAAGMVAGKSLQIASNNSSLFFDETIEIDGKKVTLDFNNPTNVELFWKGKITKKQFASSLMQEFATQFVMQLVFMKGIQGATKYIHSHIASYPKGSVSKMRRIMKPSFIEDLTKGAKYGKSFKGNVIMESFQEFGEELAEEAIETKSKTAGLGTLAVFLFGLYTSISPRSARGGNKNFFQENNITQVGELSMTGNVALQKLEINSLVESDKVIEFYKEQGFSVVEQSDGGITFEKKAVLDGNEGVQRVEVKSKIIDSKVDYSTISKLSKKINDLSNNMGEINKDVSNKYSEKLKEASSKNEYQQIINEKNSEINEKYIEKFGAGKELIEDQFTRMKVERQKILFDLIKTTRPDIKALDQEAGIYYIEKNGEKLYGSLYSIIDADESLLEYKSIADDIQFKDNSLMGIIVPSGINFNSTVVASGSFAQNKVHKFPADLDFGEHIKIQAETKEEVKNFMVNMIKDLALKNDSKNLVFDRLKIGSYYNQEKGKMDAIVRSKKEIEEGKKIIGNQSFQLEDVVLDPGFLKVDYLYIDDNGIVKECTKVTSVNITTKSGFTYNNRFNGVGYQEAYYSDPTGFGVVEGANSASETYSYVNGFLKKDIQKYYNKDYKDYNILKSCKRMYNYLKVQGDMKNASLLSTLFGSKYEEFAIQFENFDQLMNLYNKVGLELSAFTEGKSISQFIGYIDENINSGIFDALNLNSMRMDLVVLNKNIKNKNRDGVLEIKEKMKKHYSSFMQALNTYYQNELNSSQYQAIREEFERVTND